MTPEEYRVDRDELISETIAGASGNNAIRTELWYEGHLIAYIVITVSDPTGRTIGRLDCAHGTIHTHFWGHTPIDEVRTTYATIPADPDAGMRYLSATFQQWYLMMLEVAEGRRA
jgi:hypothetical protein